MLQASLQETATRQQAQEQLSQQQIMSLRDRLGDATSDAAKLQQQLTSSLEQHQQEWEACQDQHAQARFPWATIQHGVGIDGTLCTLSLLPRLGRGCRHPAYAVLSA